MPEIQVLHLLPKMSRGGAATAALAAAKYSQRAGDVAHRFAALSRADAGAQPAGAPTYELPTILGQIAAADIVVLHFYNTPEVYELLRADWPPARLAVWLHVGGRTAPQIVTPALAEFADALVAGSAFNLDLPAFAPGLDPPPLRTHIEAAADLEPLAGRAPRPHTGFKIGYAGTVDFIKMHLAYVALSAAADIPGVLFSVAGIGNGQDKLKRQAEALGVADRFEFPGFVPDLGEWLETLDVFGYPLCEDNYSGAELILQEAMAVGVPPVVLPYGGAARVVRHGITGIVAEGPGQYAAALEFLYQHPAERARLSQNARLYARDQLGADKAGRKFNELYAQMMEWPKRERHWSGKAASLVPVAPACQGAMWFVESLGEAAEPFQRSLAGRETAEVLEADARIAAASPLLASHASGGVLHYRSRYPEDAYLRLWAGLVLHRQGRAALAVAEFDGALKLGLTHWRVRWYLALAALDCAAEALARPALAAVLAAAPDFIPARSLAARLGLAQPAARESVAEAG